MILASASPRRRALLEEIGYAARVIPSDIDEARRSGESCEELARRLACTKARQQVHYARKGEVVIAADTVVNIDGTPLGKPKDGDEAFAMLRLLSGATHEVSTGVCLLVCSPTKDCPAAGGQGTSHPETSNPEVTGSLAAGDQGISRPETSNPEVTDSRLCGGSREDARQKTRYVSDENGSFLERSFVETTKVTFYDLSDACIAAYVKTGECEDKAGAYGIQGAGRLLVRKINGDYYNVVGMPIARFVRELDLLKETYGESLI